MVAQALEVGDDRVERRALVVCRALPGHDRADLVAECADELAHEAALADAGFARDVGDGALALANALPGVAQLSQLVAAADDRRELRRGGDLEAANGAGGGEDAVKADRPRDSPEFLLSKRFSVEVALDEAQRGVAHDNRTRWRCGLDAR